MSINLYCIPFAGASASMYLSWRKFLEPYDICVKPLELRGRGKRYDEKAYETMEEAVEDIYGLLIRQQGDGCEPYALYGHSMGCIIVFELIHLLERKSYTMPEHVFLSGRYPPHIVKAGKKIHLLEGEELVREILSIGGTDDSILCDSTLQNIFLPIIKADYKILETYEYRSYEKKILCAVTVVNGMQDDRVNYDEALMWKEYCKGYLNFKFLPGDHFFVRSKIEEVTNMIISTLT